MVSCLGTTTSPEVENMSRAWRGIFILRVGALLDCLSIHCSLYERQVNDDDVCHLFTLVSMRAATTLASHHSIHCLFIPISQTASGDKKDACNVHPPRPHTTVGTYSPVVNTVYSGTGTHLRLELPPPHPRCTARK